MNPAVSLHQLTAELLADAQSIVRGGGDSATERQHAKGRLTARERVELLIDPESPQLSDRVRGDYDRQMDVRYGAARGWVDAIIDPSTTRETLILALEVATRHAEDQPFRTGVFQV